MKPKSQTEQSVYAEAEQQINRREELRKWNESLEDVQKQLGEATNEVASLRAQEDDLLVSANALKDARAVKQLDEVQKRRSLASVRAECLERTLTKVGQNIQAAQIALTAAERNARALQLRDRAASHVPAIERADKLVGELRGIFEGLLQDETLHALADEFSWSFGQPMIIRRQITAALRWGLAGLIPELDYVSSEQLRRSLPEFLSSFNDPLGSTDEKEKGAAA